MVPTNAVSLLNGSISAFALSNICINTPHTIIYDLGCLSTKIIIDWWLRIFGIQTIGLMLRFCDKPPNIRWLDCVQISVSSSIIVNWRTLLRCTNICTFVKGSIRKLQIKDTKTLLSLQTRQQTCLSTPIHGDGSDNWI